MTTSGTGRRPTLTNEWLRQRYEQEGESIRALATASGWSYGYVHKKLRAAGIRIRRPGGNTRGEPSDG